MGRRTRQTKQVTVPYSHVLLPKVENKGCTIEPSKIPIYKEFLIRNKMVNSNIYQPPPPPDPNPPPDPLDKLPKIKINCLQIYDRNNPYIYFKPQLQLSNFNGAEAGSEIFSSHGLITHDQYFLVVAKVSSKLHDLNPQPNIPYVYQVWSLYSQKASPARLLNIVTSLNLLEYHIYSITSGIDKAYGYFQLNFFTPPQDPEASYYPFNTSLYFQTYHPTIDDGNVRNWTLTSYSPIPVINDQPTIPPMPSTVEGHVPCLIFDGRYYEWEVNPEYP